MDASLPPILRLKAECFQKNFDRGISGDGGGPCVSPDTELGRSWAAVMDATQARTTWSLVSSQYSVFRAAAAPIQTTAWSSKYRHRTFTHSHDEYWPSAVESRILES